RYYDRIIPTSITALQTLPFYVVPFYILKLLIQFILSTCLVAPYKIILKQPR
ncbi:glycosyltransferase family 2 protein, partial [Acinetobacter baumannii]|nr:glycosyltransferase family 2 protein [Acinetobacter baumannii]